MRINYYKEILGVLQTLKELHPAQNMGKHLATVIDDYDLWSMKDKELYYAIDKYAKQLDLDTHIDEDIDVIIKEGMNLDSFFLLADPEDAY